MAHKERDGLLSQPHVVVGRHPVSAGPSGSPNGRRLSPPALVRPVWHLLTSSGTAVSFVRSVGIQVIVLVLSLGTGMLSARLLGPTGRGIFAAVTTGPILLGSLATAGAWSAVVVRLRQASDGQQRRAVVANALLLCVGLCTILIGIGLFALPYALAVYPAAVIRFGQFCLLGSYAMALQVIYRQTFVGIGAFRDFNLITLSPQLLYLIALVAVAASIHLSAELAVMALLGTTFLALIFHTPALFRRAKPSISRIGLSQMPSFVSFVSRAAGHDIVAAFAGSLDRLFLIPFVSPAMLGSYVVALSLSRTAMVVQPAIGSVFLSSMSQRAPAEMSALHDMAFRITLHALVLPALVLMLLARRLIILIYGTGFASASGLFNLLLVDAMMQCLIAITTQLFMSLDRPGSVSVIYTLSFGTLAVGMAVLVPLDGAQGAAIAVVTATTVRLLLLLLGMRFVLRVPLPRLHLKKSDFVYVRSRFAA